MLSFIGALTPPHPSTQGKLYGLPPTFAHGPCPRERSERVSASRRQRLRTDSTRARPVLPCAVGRIGYRLIPIAFQFRYLRL